MRDIIVQYLLSAFQYLAVNNTHSKVFPNEPPIFTLLRVIGKVHENVTTESLLNLMLISKRLMIRKLRCC